MDTTNLVLDEITGFDIDPKTGAVLIVATGPDNAKAEITFKYGAVTALLTSVAACPVTEQGQPAMEYMRPLRPRGAGAFRLPNGEIGIGLRIADRMTVPFVIPATGIQALRNELDKLEKLAR